MNYTVTVCLSGDAFAEGLAELARTEIAARSYPNIDHLVMRLHTVFNNPRLEFKTNEPGTRTEVRMRTGKKALLITLNAS